MTETLGTQPGSRRWVRRLAAALVPLVAAGALGWWFARPDPGGIELTGRGTSYAVTVRFDPEPRTGAVTADIQVDPAADAVRISTVMPDMGHATPELTAQPAGPGRFRASGELFFMAGGWELAVDVSGPRGTEQIVLLVAVDE
jgi:hypothetical protein